MCNQWCFEFGIDSLPYIQKSAKILEVGSRNVNGSMRDVLSERASEYVGIDLFDGPGVDMVCDVAALTDSFANQSFDLVVSTEMLEHCLAWQDALFKMVSVLRPDGLLLITTRSPGFELHDYPSDHWRFSYSDFEQIFKPLGEIIAIQSDMTLGWPCGIGILVKRKLEQSQLVEWKSWIDTFDVYSMADEPALLNKGVESTPVRMIFDQYSRYKACSDLLLQTGFVAGNTLLDVGSGPECLFGQFIPDAAMAYVDPLIPDGSGQGYITGDVFSTELDGQLFDCVSAVDVLEHVPSEYRQSFLARMASLSKNTLILGFPTSDTTDAQETDELINAEYRAVFDQDYSWLKEHEQFGLPSLDETVQYLCQLGWHCQTVGHGYLPWLRKLLSFVICVWEVPSLHDIVLAVSEKFNRELYQHDFRSPNYRQFVIATRTPLLTIIQPKVNTNFESAEIAFLTLLRDAQQECFIESLQKLVKNEHQISDLNQKVEDVSCWGKSEHEKLNSLTKALSDKQAELMTMSDWAYEMRQELGRYNDSKMMENDDKLAVQATKVAIHDAKVAEHDAKVAEHDAKVVEHDAKVAEHAAKVAEHDAKVAEHDAKVAEHHVKIARQVCDAAFLNKDIEMFSVKAKLQDEKISSLNKALVDKHAELIKMSDWAQGMMFELNQRRGSFFSIIEKTAKRGGKFARQKVGKSFLGDMVRHIREHRRFLEKQVSLESIKQSLLDNNGRLIITFPIITWNFRWQRPQHIVSFLRDNRFSVLYVAMSLSPLGRRLRGHKDAVAHLNFTELAPHVNKVWLHSRNKLNIYTDSVEGDDLFNIALGLDSLISELHPQSILYLVQFPGWGGVAQTLRKKFGGTILFDCMDDHAGFNTNSKKILECEKALLENADLVITSSDLLEKRAKIINPNTIQVKNGTEFKHFTNPIQNGQLDHLGSRPIIGYYGAISDWFDMDLVAHCALQRPDWNFVLIGSTFGADLQSVDGLQNVHFLGEKPYQDLPGFLAYFDVCTIPFKIIPLTLATNPVKFYEYLSAGKPVVSVALPELFAYQDNCYLADTADEFLEQLEQAFRERRDQEKIERRLKLASDNSWDARGRVILESKTLQTHLYQAEINE